MKSPGNVAGGRTGQVGQIVSIITVEFVTDCRNQAGFVAMGYGRVSHLTDPSQTIGLRNTEREIHLYCVVLGCTRQVEVHVLIEMQIQSCPACVVYGNGFDQLLEPCALGAAGQFQGHINPQAEAFITQLQTFFAGIEVIILVTDQRAVVIYGIDGHLRVVAQTQPELLLVHMVRVINNPGGSAFA